MGNDRYSKKEREEWDGDERDMNYYDNDDEWEDNEIDEDFKEEEYDDE